MSERIPDLNFSIDSRLLEELGENLVTRNHVAVAELIKNAYDADATKVELEFTNARNNREGPSEICIQDDGTGMTFDEIRNKWMRIGTTDKIRNPRTDVYGREKTGDKGIGRFSCRRLGDWLGLTSIAEDPEPTSDRYIETHLEFPWSEFERETNVNQIPVESEVEYHDEAETGVTLEIRELRDEWTQRDFDTLRRNVLTLSAVSSQRRDGFEEDPGFGIFLDAPEFDSGKGNLVDQVYDAGWCTLEGEFTSDGGVKLAIEAKRIGQRSYKLQKEYDGLAGTQFRIAFIPSDKEHYRDTSTLSLERAREITADFGGIRVYKDGFRVYPYGAQNNDWLRLDQFHAKRSGSPDQSLDEAAGELELHNNRSRVLLIHPKNDNLVGRVSIATDANLKMKTDREGFIQNDSYENLRDGIRVALQWLTLQYSNYQALKEKEDLEEEAKELRNQLGEKNDGDSSGTSSDTSGLDDWASDFAGSADSSDEGGSASVSKATFSGTTDTKTVDQAVSVLERASESMVAQSSDEDISGAVETASKVVRTSVSKTQKEVDFYRSAFSVNQFIFSFMHELRDVIMELEEQKTDLDGIAESLPADQAQPVQSVHDEISDLQTRFEQQMELFGVLTSSQQGSNVKELRIKTYVEELVDSVAYICEDYDIDIETEVPANLFTPPMLQTELYSVILNLLTNSLKSVIAEGGSSRRVRIMGEKRGEMVVLRVSDTGQGLSVDNPNLLFDTLVSDPEGTMYDALTVNMPEDLSSQLGSGSGLGLSIVQDIANKYGGEAQFVEKDGWDATVEVTFQNE